MRPDWSSSKKEVWNCPRTDSLLLKVAISPCEQSGVGDSLIAPNMWTHVAMTYDGGTKIQIFVNSLSVYDQQCGTSPSDISITDGDLRIGSAGGVTILGRGITIFTVVLMKSCCLTVL